MKARYEVETESYIVEDDAGARGFVVTRKSYIWQVLRTIDEILAAAMMGVDDAAS